MDIGTHKSELPTSTPYSMMLASSFINRWWLSAFGLIALIPPRYGNHAEIYANSLTGT
ncbi:MAG: hypothetical protein PUP91_29930 [Rhizonema sp. PD37]|nr:hypothetical protein [Rhizonema sp. PD37]